MRSSLSRVLLFSLLSIAAACGGGDHGGHGDGANGGDTSADVNQQGDGSMDAFDATSTMIPDGATVLPDGAVILPDGALWNPDGSVDIDATNDDARAIPDGATVLPDGAVILPDGAIWDPDASTSTMDGGGIPDGATVLPDGAVILPDGAIWMPDDGGLPDGAFVLPDGGIYNPADASCPNLPDGGAPCGTTEICGNGFDDNCNHLVDEGCTCLPGEHERCYDGCIAQAGVGECHFGSMACPTGGEFGTYDGHCDGAGHPSMVICGGFRDYLCDGVIDEGCSCTAGEMRPCYDGPPSTRGVGACQDGVQTCAAVDGGTAWGPCTGEVLPTAPACDGIDHACDGNPFGGCACTPGATRMCYTGPPGTEGIGVCRGGMQSCIVTGGMAGWGPCVGEITPSPDMCDGIDRLCNGMPNPGCICMPGATRACYDGPVATRGVGLCHDGMQTCVSVSGATMWGPCTGEQTPTPEICDGLDHLCNNMPNTGCLCTPGTSRSCYSGPAGTAGVGLCHAGTQMCVSGPGGVGSSWGPCAGEVTPAADQCDGIDRNCDGMANPGCTCPPGGTRSCYDGPAGTAGVGVCRSGTQTCNPTGTGWGACVGEVLPGPEVCDGIDHLCNGMPNTGCACTPGATQPCYDGPAGTAGVGLCHAGMQTCVAGPGGVGSSWGACTGEVVPSANRCDGVDRMCDGMPYAGCLCVPGTTRSCYDGPAGTAGVGLCHAGMQSCIDSGSGPMWGACTGEMVPGPEVCDGLDHLCNGVPNTGCACMPGQTQSCYTGPAGTAGVGTCRAGTQSCVCMPGMIGCNWGMCTGEVLPGPIVCDGLDHACDGNYSADCPCMPGAMRSCYSGPPGTAGVGTCRAGNQTCVARTGGGSMWGTCTGEVDPAAPACDGLDHACTGMLPNCAPTVMCPAPVTTSAGLSVSLTGTASAIAPATIVSYSWTVISSPAGSTYTFSSMTTNPTTFTPNSAGVYTVRFTATDSMGRSSSCNVLVTATTNSYLGTEFWAVSTTNSELLAGNTFHFAVAIGNPNPRTVTAVVSGGALASPLTFTIPANSTVTQTLPWVTALSNNSVVLTTPPGCCDSLCATGGTFTPGVSALVANGAYRIATSDPVSAYQFNALEYSSTALCSSGTNSYTNDASLLLPTVALTGNYLVLSHNAFSQAGSFATIVGTDPSPTTVTVRLSAPITAGPGVAAAAAGTTQTYTLNRGDVVQLISTWGTALQFGTQDMTGTTVTANHPVSVISGVDCTFMSYPSGTTYACDHIEQQMFPVETWGRDYVVSQLRDRTATENYMVRILSRNNSNTITFLPAAAHAAVTLNAGQFIEFESNRDFEVQGTQPFLVAQYMEGQDTTPGATVGDPAFVLEVPTPQYRTDYNFVVPATYTSSFINVVGVTGSTIRLDGTVLSAAPVAIAGTTWSVWRQAVSAGSHTINTTGSPFGLKVVGVAPYTSYTYPGGLDLRALP